MIRAFSALLLLFLCALACGSLYWAGRHARAKSDDLLRRAEEVQLFLARSDPYADPDSTYPPTALPFFSALVSAVPAARLKDSWLVLNLVLVAVVSGTAIKLWGREWPETVQALFILVIAASKPVRLGIGLGQFHLVPTALLLLSLFALRTHRPTLAGLLFGLALTKPTLTLPFVGYLLLKKEWRAVGAALVVQAIALLAVVLWLQRAPIFLISEWLARAKTQVASGTVDLPTLVLHAWPDHPEAATPLALTTLALSLFGLLRCKKASDLGLISLCAWTACVFTYHRPYDLVILTPALAYQFRLCQRPARAWPWFVAFLFAAILIIPSDPRMTGLAERVYDLIFTICFYIVLAVAILSIHREGCEGRPK
jgi:hypothetical protein